MQSLWKGFVSRIVKLLGLIFFHPDFVAYLINYIQLIIILTHSKCCASMELCVWEISQSAQWTVCTAACVSVNNDVCMCVCVCVVLVALLHPILRVCACVCVCDAYIHWLQFVCVDCVLPNTVHVNVTVFQRSGYRGSIVVTMVMM